jgi:hypothetical protein
MTVANLVCPRHGTIETRDEGDGPPTEETCPVVTAQPVAGGREESPCGERLERQVIEP